MNGIRVTLSVVVSQTIGVEHTSSVANMAIEKRIYTVADMNNIFKEITEFTEPYLKSSDIGLYSIMLVFFIDGVPTMEARNSYIRELFDFEAPRKEIMKYIKEI